MSLTAQQQTYTRPVSPTEMWFLTYPASIPGVIQLIVEGTGDLDADRLRLAVATASEACPGARLTRKAMLWVDSGVAPRVRVARGEGFDRATFTGLPELHEPLLGDSGGPTCEVVLIPGTTLIFRAFHGVMDGKGVLLWVEDIFRVLRGEEPLGAPSRITEGEFLAGLREPAPGMVVPDLEWPSALGERGSGDGFIWRRRTIAGVHPGLVAKLGLAITKACGLPTGRFRIPADLRRYDPSLRSTGNLTNNPLVDVHASESWEAAHERLLTLLAAGHDIAARAEPDLPKMPLPALRRQILGLDRFSAEHGRYGSVATLSHVGKVSLESLSAAGFSADTVYALPNSGPAGPPELNAVEVDGRTELTIGWYDGPGTADRAEALFDQIEDFLAPHRFWAGNETSQPLRHSGTVVRQFAEQVGRTPDAVALTGPGGTVTYAELDRLSDSVAAGLQDSGVGPGSLVGILTGRTIAAMAGIWGVLKTGAAYLPLDPSHPDARLASVLASSGASVCLVSREFADRGIGSVVLEDLLSAGRSPSPVDVSGTDLAYVIYTSGSTGQPKGVEIEHRQLAVYASWGIRIYGLSTETRFPLFSSLAFDLSNTAIFLPLLVGGSVVLVAEELNHVVLRSLLTEWNVNALKVTPTHLDLIARLGLGSDAMKVVIAGGELLRGSVAATAQAAFPSASIFNEYGPTETTVGCMTRCYTAADASLPSVPIGLPTDNTRIHLLDSSGRFVAPGEVGEMYLAGDQLARGYRGQPSLTRSRFVRLADGSRAYRTGDLARELPSGELESVGRTDEQLKVLGYRIEPAEVARVLEEHPLVTRAFAAGVTRPGTDSKALVAWFVGSADPSDLSAHVAARLPKYMVPSAVLPVADLPQTGNGKVDVSALPTPFAEASAGPVVEIDPVSAEVAAVWARVLGVSTNLGEDADFNQLGGNSATLLAMLAAVCADVVGAEHEAKFMAHLPAIIRTPTLGQVAQVVRTVRG